VKHIAIAITAFLLAGCVSSLAPEQRAFIQCQQAGRGESCVRDTLRDWSRLEQDCARMDQGVLLCAAEFERLYGCRAQESTVYTEDYRGRPSLGAMTTEAGMACNMYPGEVERLRAAVMNDCLGSRGIDPRPLAAAGARCECYGAHCQVSLPSFDQATIERYYPSR
jgi:hypothetical protein